MAPARKQIKLFRNIREGSRTPATPPQKMLHEDAEEAEFGYPKTRCLSSYYSIFVARLAIMVMLAILIGMLTMLTWHFTRTYTTNSIKGLAYGLRYELLQRPILRMWNILNSTVEITVAQVKLSEYVISHYERPEEHGQQTELYEAMRDITWALFASKRALNAITISYTNGFVQAFHRDRRSNNTYYIYSDLEVPKGQGHHVQVPGSRGSTNMSAIWYRLPLDPATGNKIGTRSQIPPDDLIKIAGLSQVREGTASWHIDVSKFSDSPLLSAALPVRHPSRGNIVAVVGVTTATKSVGQLMKELVEFHSGYMYLTSKEGYLLATSTDAPLLKNTTNGPKLMMANDSQDRMIKSGAEWLWRTYGDKFPINHEVHAENIILGQHKYYIDSFFLNLKRLPLVGVIIIPRKYVMGQVDKIGFTTLIILITASICILAIGCVCVLILTSGISKAMKLKAELISHLDARRRAEASSNYKSQFLANMSHELRTPMAAVIGLLDILMIDDCLTNEQFATVTQIRKCSTALLRLLNNILDLSKVESGKLVLEEAEFDLGQELEGLLDMFSVQCMNNKVEMILDICDSMPKIVRGDSARVVQIFTNLISNSIKFTSEGHIILRGWHESSDHPRQSENHNNQKTLQDVLKTKAKQKECTMKRDCKKEDKITIWFEVEDTGCGIDPSKWETVFESFEQADPSTTRTHGGTGLGLCIVRNLVNKMGGEIKVMKKEGPGTLMQLYLVLGMAKDGQQIEKDLSKCSFTVLLALNGSKGRAMMTQWLQENRVSAREASDWNGFTQILHQVFQSNTPVKNSYVELSVKEHLELKRKREVTKQIDFERKRTSEVVIIVDTGLLDQSTNIWNEQLIFLDQYRGQAKFVWVLSHDTSNAIKVELRRRGNLLMVNKPLYKTKLIQILEAVASEENYEDKKGRASETSVMLSDYSECHVIDPIQFDSISSEDSGTSDTENSESKTSRFPHSWKFDSRNSLEIIPQKSNNMLVAEVKCNISDINHSVRDGLATKENEAEKQRQDCLLKCIENFSELKQQADFRINKSKEANQNHIKNESGGSKEWELQLMENRNPAAAASCRGLEINKYKDTCLDMNKVDCLTPKQMVPHQNHLKGLYILLAEDNPILQRVATTMLEKLGAKVVAVGDGTQAVDTLKCMFSGEKNARKDIQVDVAVTNQTPKPFPENLPIDLVLMDCQMPKMDGYEATKAIRELEAGSHMHIPIVALTAHAMSSDEAKCLEVGMDAYLTKPIDCKLMVSTILTLIQRNS